MKLHDYIFIALFGVLAAMSAAAFVPDEWPWWYSLVTILMWGSLCGGFIAWALERIGTIVGKKIARWLHD